MSNEEQQIIDKLGTSHTKPIVFDNRICISGLYTYRGQVCCLHEGMDFDFSTLSTKEQKQVLNEVLSKKWVVNAAFQG